MYRRRVCAGLAVGGAAAIAGCLDGLLDDLTTFSATPAEVAADAADEAGYEHEETREEVEEEEVGGETVEITNYRSEYRRTIEVPIVGELEGGVFGTVATPQVSVAGEEFNPVGEYGPRELADEVQQQYEELSIDEEVDSRTVNPFETSTEVTTFEGVATVAGTEIDVFVDVSRFEHADDHIVAVGVYPEAFPEEAERVTTMIEGLEHD